MTSPEIDAAPFELVLRRYFDRIDALDPEGAVEHFAEDARAEIMTGKVLEGRDRIGRALRRVLVAYETTLHHSTNVRATADGDEAEVWSYVWAYHRMKATGRPWLLWVRLYDRFANIDGRWQIVVHRLHGVDSIPRRPDIPPEWYFGHPERPSAAKLPPPAERGLAAIGAAVPDVAAGMALLRAAAEADGVLPATAKALIAAAAAATKGHEDLLERWLKRARELGVSDAEAWGAAGVLLTSRGEEVANRFAVAVLELYGSPEPAAPELTADAGEAETYFREYYGGEIPPRFALVAERAPDAFTGFYLLHRGALRAEGLEPKVRELILCAISAADFEPEFLRIHARVAQGIGATAAEVVEAVLTVLPVAGLAVWSGAAAVLAELD